MALSPALVDRLRAQFPALSREVNGQPAAFFDGPGGTQTPARVIEAVAHSLARANANHAGCFVTSQESDEMLAAAHEAVADFLGASDPECVVFGANMTTLTLHLSRSLARTWQPGDEVLVTRLDHDANVTPWVLAARDAGATVRYVDFRREDCTLDLDDLQRKLSPRTKLVAVGCASNSVGTINPVQRITELAHAAGALVFLDAVHYAMHALVDVQGWGCDFLACSAYKFFGPHVGALWGRRELLESLEPYKLRPAPNELPGKWMTGTQNHEGIAGVRGAVEYLAEVGRLAADQASLARRPALAAAFAAIGQYERSLTAELLSALAELPDVRVYGITDPRRLEERFATVAFTHRRYTPRQLAQRLGERGLFAWHGNYYALQLTETLGLEPDGMLRVGFVHYNTPAEVRRLAAELRALSPS